MYDDFRGGTTGPRVVGGISFTTPLHRLFFISRSGNRAIVREKSQREKGERAREIAGTNREQARGGERIVTACKIV